MVDRIIWNALDERSRRVLNAVIKSYIDKPEPVGSRYVTKKYAFGFSPATIRNIMADLEELGFLSQPHTSAGRIPTDKGYRFYVDTLRHDEQGAGAEVAAREYVNQFNHRMEEFKRDVSALFSEVTQTLSSFSNYVSIALPPQAERMTFNRIDLIKYKGDQVVAILLTDEGIFKHKVVQADPSLRQEDLTRLADFLNAEFSGHTVDEIKGRIIQLMHREKAQWDTLVSRAIAIYEQALGPSDDQMYVAGLYDVMNLPDFSDITKIKELSKAIKEKHLIVKLLGELADADGVQVIIGEENPVDELKGLSVVSSTYKEGGRPMGIIALIGPKRMDYSKAIFMVDAFAKCVGRAFED